MPKHGSQRRFPRHEQRGGSRGNLGFYKIWSLRGLGATHRVVHRCRRLVAGRDYHSLPTFLLPKYSRPSRFSNRCRGRVREPMRSASFSNAAPCARSIVVGSVVWRWRERLRPEGIGGLPRDTPRPARIPPLPAETSDPFAIAQVQEFNSYLCSTVHVAHAHGRRGARWADDAAAIEAMKCRVPATMTECFALIERKLLKGPWVMGEQYPICDPYLFTIGTWIEGDGVDTT